MSSRSQWGWFIHAFAAFSKHTDKIGETGGTNADSPFRQYVARLIDDSDIVVVFGPIDPTRRARYAHVDPLSASRIELVDWAPAA